MKTSVIVSSVNRKATFLRLFANLAEQTVLPDEVILIEAGDVLWTSDDAPAKMKEAFRPFSAPREGLSSSRQRGAKAARGEILFFFDDDIVLPNTYIAGALAYLEAHPDIMAIGGAYTDKEYPESSERAHWIARLFGIHADGQRNRFLPSGWTDFVRGKFREEETPAEWMFGCNFVVRARAFEKVKFEARMKAWCFLEDSFFGFSLGKAFGDCMRLLPTLRVLHDPPASSGKISSSTLRMRMLYRYLFWRDCLVQEGRGKRVPFLLGMAANFLLMMKQERKFWVIPDTLKTLAFIIKNPHMNWDGANEFIFQKN